MKPVVTCLLLFVFSTLSAQTFFKTQTWSTLEKARIVACLVKGEVGNFVNLVDNEMQFDFSGRHITDQMFNTAVAEMNQFLYYYIDTAEMQKYKVVVITRDQNGRRQKIYPDFVLRYTLAKDTLLAIRCYLNLLPYMSFEIRQLRAITILLKRVMGYSPIEPNQDFINLIAWVYKRQFGTRDRQGVHILEEHGTDKKIKSAIWEFDWGYDYGWIESRIKAKINETINLN